MKQIVLPDFAPVVITPDDVVNAARAFKGLRYRESGTWVEYDAAGNPTHGSTNCFGLLFLVAVRLGLVPDTIFRLLSVAAASEPLPFILMRFLDRNCVVVERDDLAPGDIAFFRWPDAMPGQISLDRRRHHVGFFSGFEPLPCGSMVHALDTDANERGGVFETILQPDDARHIQRLYRIPQTVPSQTVRS